MLDILLNTWPQSLIRHDRDVPKRRKGNVVPNGGCRFEPLEPRLLLSVTLFSGYTELDVAPYPDGMIVVDINNDGNDDIITANVGKRPPPPIPEEFDFSHTISVLLGNGDGTFSQSSEYESGEEPLRIAAGYFNNDEWLDLAVTNGKTQSTVSILLGKEDSQSSTTWDGFELPTSIDVRDNPSVDPVVDVNGIVAADFDQDGNIDLGIAVAEDDPYDPFVMVLLGDGNGAFSKGAQLGPSDLTDRARAFEIAAGDFNDDSFPDIAVTYRDNFNSITIILNQGVDGQGDWLGINEFDDVIAGSYPRGITVEDFDEDGLDDVAISTEGTASTSDSIAILLGKVDGSNDWDGFETAVLYEIGDEPLQLNAADLNADGVLDLFASIDGDDAVSVLFGLDDGTFVPGGNHAVGNFPSGVAAGDFNEDGFLDIATANWVNDTGSPDVGHVSVLSFSLEVLTAGLGRTELAHGDFDDDGVADLATVTSTDIRVLLNKGGAEFDDTDTDYYIDLDLPTGVDAGDISDIIAADVIGSSDVDIIFTDSINHKVWIIENNDSTGLDFEDGDDAQGFDVGYSPRGVIAANFHDDLDTTDDGKLDLATVNWYSESVTILWAQSGGGFDDTQADGKREDFIIQDTILGSVTDFAAGHYTVDGYLDLAVIADGYAEVYVTKNDDGDGFAAMGTSNFRTFDISGPGTSIATGDFDDDDRSDLAITVATSLETGIDDNVVNVLFGRINWFNDTLQDGARQVHAVGSMPVGITAADFDGDGIDDFAVANQVGDSVTIYYGVSDTDFSIPLTILDVGNYPWSIVSANFDESDGAFEIALTVYYDGAIRIILSS